MFSIFSNISSKFGREKERIDVRRCESVVAIITIGDTRHGQPSHDRQPLEEKEMQALECSNVLTGITLQHKHQKSLQHLHQY